MTILLEHYFAHRSAVDMDTYACRYLAERSVAAACMPSARGVDVDLSSYSMLVSRGALPDELRAKVRCFGGRRLSRIESLAYVRRAGMAQMDWAAAASLEDVEALFGEWETERLILKRSDSYKGRGLRIFSRQELEDLEWNPERDVFCAEVNREDGAVVKVECLAGHLLLTWLWRQPPIHTVIANGVIDEQAYLSGVRVPDIELPEDVLAGARHCSALATRDGLGHISLDLMRSPDGQWRVIEMNSQEVAVWWTSQFETVRRSYAHALYLLAMEFPHAEG